MLCTCVFNHFSKLFKHFKLILNSFINFILSYFKFDFETDFYIIFNKLLVHCGIVCKFVQNFFGVIFYFFKDLVSCLHQSVTKEIKTVCFLDPLQWSLFLDILNVFTCPPDLIWVVVGKNDSYSFEQMLIDSFDFCEFLIDDRH